MIPNLNDGELDLQYDLLNGAKKAAEAAALEAQVTEKQYAAYKEAIEAGIVSAEHGRRDTLLYMQRRAQVVRSAAEGAENSVSEAEKSLKECTDLTTDAEILPLLRDTDNRLPGTLNKDFWDALGKATARIEEARRFAELASSRAKEMETVRLKQE